MTRPTHRNATRVAAVLAVLALVLLGAPWSAPRAQAYRDGQFLKVVIDEVNPQTVTTVDSMVTVRGTVANVGDRPVTDVVVRLEHADAVTTSSDLRASLHGHHDQFRPVGEFVTVAGTLEQGQQRPFSLAFPLRGGTGANWNIDTPGVYPALVNVNGTPDYGAPARLDDARFLLPVLGVPPPNNAASEPEVAPDTSRPVGLTLLWPLADRPRLAPGQPGGPTPVRLLDDQLERSLSPGGRLDALLGALEFATEPAVDPKGELARTVCVAVDPDLLVTVNEMTQNYQVLDNSADPAGPVHPGTGQGLAVAWLDRLRAMAKHTCVTPLPYAQASLDAVAEMADDGLSHQATTGAADVLDQILGVVSLRGATLLGDSHLSAASIDLLTAQGPTVAVSPLPSGQETPPDFNPRRVSDTLVAAPFDPSVGAALSAVGRTPMTPDYVPQSLRFALQHDSRTARMQDALGAMAWQALSPQQTPRQTVLLPDATWDLSDGEARSILSATSTLLHSGLAIPRPLPTLIGEARAGAQPTLWTPPSVSTHKKPWTTGYLRDSVTRFAACGGSPPH
ncbi:putative secreted protein [Mycobacteroides abscessus]|nr:putative secreted protein [Mycobacteroides abscessus]